MKNIFIKLAANICLSLTYSLAVVLLLYICVEPYLSPAVSVLSVISGNKADSLTIKSIYVPNGEAEPEFVYKDNEIVEVIEFIDGYDKHASEIQFPKYGELYGEFSIEAAEICLDLYMGDSLSILKLGVGQFYPSVLPGFKGTTIIAGHNTSPYLKPISTFIDDGSIMGEIVKIATSYGDFYYQVYDYKVLPMTDTSPFTEDTDEDRLVFYTCYPFNSIGHKTDRVYVFARKIAGRNIIAD